MSVCILDAKLVSMADIVVCSLSCKHMFNIWKMQVKKTCELELNVNSFFSPGMFHTEYVSG